jgi:hypothetical protein
MNRFRLLISLSVLSMALVAGSIVLRISVHDTVLYHEFTPMGPFFRRFGSRRLSHTSSYGLLGATQLPSIEVGYFRMPESNAADK